MPSAVVLRVGIQYLLEMLTDVGPALMVQLLGACCGSRFAQEDDLTGAASTGSVDVITDTAEGDVHVSVAYGAAVAAAEHGGVLLVALPGVGAVAATQPEVAPPDKATAPAGDTQRAACDVCVLRKVPVPPDVQRKVPVPPDVQRSVQSARDAFVARDAAMSSDPFREAVPVQQLLFKGVYSSRVRHFFFQVVPAVLPGDNAQVALARLTWSQLAMGSLLLRCEVTAVRLVRAWEMRLPRWQLLYILGTTHAIMLATRVIAAPDLRCPYEDGQGWWFWNFCTEAEGGGTPF